MSGRNYRENPRRSGRERKVSHPYRRPSPRNQGRKTNSGMDLELSTSSSSNSGLSKFNSNSNQGRKANSGMDLELSTSSSSNSGLSKFNSNSNQGKKDNSGLSEFKPNKIPVNSSKARHLRKLQSSHNNNTNYLQSKYVKPETDSSEREVLYVTSQSLGMGNKSFTHEDEHFETSGGEKRKRKHTEAQAVAVERNRKLDLDGEELNLSGYNLEYTTSTNEACAQKRSENCSTQMVPELTESGAGFNYVNPYSGSKNAGGFGKLFNKHNQRANNKEDDYQSESESEDEYQVLHVDPEKMRGKTFSNEDAIPVKGFLDHLKEGKDYESKHRNKRYRDEFDSDSE